MNVNDGNGHAYTGSVRCLRVAGRNASMVVPFPARRGSRGTARGAVWWLHDGIAAPTRAGYRKPAAHAEAARHDLRASPGSRAAHRGGSFRATQSGSCVSVTGP